MIHFKNLRASLAFNLAIALGGTALSTQAFAETEAVKSNASLKLVNAASIYSQTDLSQYYTDIAGFINFACFDQKIIGNYMFSSYSNLPTIPFTATPLSGAGGFVSAISYDVTGNNLTNVSTLRTANGKGVIQTAISPDTTYPLIALSTATNLITGGPFSLEIHTYDPATGIINPTPASITGFHSLVPQEVDNILCYNGATSFSHDGKYLFYTLSVDTNNDGTADSQIFGILEVSADGTTVTPVLNIPTPNNGEFFFAQPDILTFKPHANKNLYKVIVGYTSFVPNDLTAPFTNSLLVSYDFNADANTFVQIGSQPLPNIIQGYDINPNHDRIVVTTNPVNTSPSVLQNVPAAFSNNSPQPDQVFRLYSFDAKASSNALSFISGHNFNMGSWNVRWSHDGKYIAVVLAHTPTLTAYLSPLTGASVPAGTPLTANTPSMVALLKFNSNKDTFKLKDIQPASAYASDLSWSTDDSTLGVSGQSNPDLKEILLFEVKK